MAITKQLALTVLLAGSLFGQLPDAPSRLSSAPSPVRSKRAFIVTELAVAGSTAFDLVSTQGALSRGCRETNPLLGPNPSMGKGVAIIGAVEAGSALLDYFLFRHSSRKSTWMWFPIARVGMHAGAGINNLNCGVRR